MTEPPAEVRQWAAVQWQMYTSLIQEGFDEDQAMGIIITLMLHR